MRRNGGGGVFRGRDPPAPMQAAAQHIHGGGGGKFGVANLACQFRPPNHLAKVVRSKPGRLI